MVYFINNRTATLHFTHRLSTNQLINWLSSCTMQEYWAFLVQKQVQATKQINQKLFQVAWLFYKKNYINLSVVSALSSFWQIRWSMPMRSEFWPSHTYPYLCCVKLEMIVYKCWLLMRGMVENDCPRGEIRPWPTMNELLNYRYELLSLSKLKVKVEFCWEARG